jgi:putative peptidoglycan lipid II flippase
MVVNALVAYALYEPFGIAGIVVGTVAGTLVMTVAQGWLLRNRLAGIEGARTLGAVLRMLAAAAVLAAASYLAWRGLDEWLGRSLLAQVASVGTGIAAGLAAYVAAVWTLRVSEARQVARLLTSRRG